MKLVSEDSAVRLFSQVKMISIDVFVDQHYGWVWVLKLYHDTGVIVLGKIKHYRTMTAAACAAQRQLRRIESRAAIEPVICPPALATVHTEVI